MHSRDELQKNMWCMHDSAPGPAWLGFNSRQLWSSHFNLKLQRAAACNLWACEHLSRCQLSTMWPTQTMQESLVLNWPRWVPWQKKITNSYEDMYPWRFFIFLYTISLVSLTSLTRCRPIFHSFDPLCHQLFIGFSERRFTLGPTRNSFAKFLA